MKNDTLKPFSTVPLPLQASKPVSGFSILAASGARPAGALPPAEKLSALRMQDSFLEKPATHQDIEAYLRERLHGGAPMGMMADFLQDALVASRHPLDLIRHLYVKQENALSRLLEEMFRRINGKEAKPQNINLFVAAAEMMAAISLEERRALGDKIKAGNNAKRILKSAKKCDAHHPDVVGYGVIRSLSDPAFNFDATLVRLDKSLAKHPGNPRLLEAKATIYSHIGDYDAALDWSIAWQKSLPHSIFPVRAIDALREQHMADNLRALKMMEEDGYVSHAAKRAAVLTARYPDHAAITEEAARLATVRRTIVGDYLKKRENRVEHAEQAAGMLLQLAQDTYAGGDFAQSVKCYEQYLMMKPTHYKARSDYANSLRMGGQADAAVVQALEAYRGIQQRPVTVARTISNPHPRPLYFRHATEAVIDAYMEARRYAEAQPWLEMALSRQPENVSHLVNLSRVYEDRAEKADNHAGRIVAYEQAAKLLQRGVTKIQSQGEAPERAARPAMSLLVCHGKLHRLHKEVGNRHLAESHLRQAEKLVASYPARIASDPLGNFYAAQVLYDRFRQQGHSSKDPAEYYRLNEARYNLMRPLVEREVAENRVDEIKGRARYYIFYISSRLLHGGENELCQELMLRLPHADRLRASAGRYNLGPVRPMSDIQFLRKTVKPA